MASVISVVEVKNRDMTSRQTGDENTPSYGHIVRVQSRLDADGFAADFPDTRDGWRADAGGGRPRQNPSAVLRKEERPPSANVPPLSMTCPMHPDVVESSPGDCPICKMKLVPVRLETVWTCPVHLQVAEPSSGKCPIDHRDLIQMTVALTWTCAGHPEIDRVDRGSCPDGTPMTAKRTLRPHGNHNPAAWRPVLHGSGQLPSLEGAYPRAGVFRLYLYDDYARPLPLDQVKRLKARAVTKESHDPATHTTKELAVFPLTVRGRVSRSPDRQPGADGAGIRESPLQERCAGIPLRLHVRGAIRRSRSRPPPRRARPPLPPCRAPARGLVQSPRPRRATPAPAAGSPPTVDPSLVPLPIPDAVHDIVDAARDASRTGRRIDSPRRFHRGLRPGVSGEGSGHRPRGATRRSRAGQSRQRRTGDSVAWCERPGCSTRSAIWATGSRLPTPTRCSAPR